MKYKFLDDLQSDVLFEAYGKDLEELLVNASEAIASIMAQTDKIKPEKTIEIEARGKDYEELMHEWLSQLLIESELKEMFFSKFQVKIENKDGEYLARGKAFGEDMSREKGETVIKAVTYYKFKVEERKQGFYARISCDV